MNGRARRLRRFTGVTLTLWALSACVPTPGDCKTTLVIETEPCGDVCAVEFGEVTIGLQDNRRVHVESACEAGADIFLDENDDGAFAITQLATFPQAVARVAFTPSAQRDYAGSLSITVFAEDSDDLFFLDLRGTGSPP